MKKLTFIFVLVLLGQISFASEMKFDKCLVKDLQSSFAGEPESVVFQCGSKIQKAFLFSETQKMLLEKAFKTQKKLTVSFEKMDKKRTAVLEVGFN